MLDNNFWLCLNGMVGILCGDREEAEATLDRLEVELRKLPSDKRSDLRHELMMVVGQLARLATRINEMES
jgi:hypothetical protein